MEAILAADNPLAAYLEGEGTAESFINTEDASFTSTPPETPSFAPNRRHATPSKAKSRTIPPLHITIPSKGSVDKARIAVSRAVNSRLGRKDNAQFLEHFRYIVIASQLLSEYPEQGALQSAAIQNQASGSTTAGGTNALGSDLRGVVAIAVLAFALVWLIQWTKNGPKTSRILLVLAFVTITVLASYGYLRRQWLKSLRQEAVEAVSALTTNLQALELSTTATLSMVQEVELVSKGYRMSFPLPPIPRLEEVKLGRRCGRQRKLLQKTYAEALPAFKKASEMLQGLHDTDDLEKYLDVYDIPHHAVKEAQMYHSSLLEDEDPESLRSLRMVSYQYNTLRRVLLCSLLALEADGGKPDFARWRTAVDVMTSLSTTIAAWATKLHALLLETEQFALPSTPKQLTPSGKSHERLRSQVRKISALSSGIRGLQAKMALLREESNKCVESSDDLTDLGPNLMAQYEAIGADLRALMQAWETGKASLATNIDRQERRISRSSLASSTGLRSPVGSLGGLTAVDEDGNGSPADALRKLMGEGVGGSNRSSLASTPEDEEVFEAIAMPKTRERSGLTREERIAKMHEERQRQASVRDKRESNTNMLRELESVINLRPRRPKGDRITSL